jgi:outer membrane lipoprotein-sorting protein
MWWGGLCILTLLGAVSVRADEKADALLKEVDKASKAAKTLTATITTSMAVADQNVQSTGTVRLKQPNLARIEFTKSEQVQTVASDGKNVFLLMPGNLYMKMPVQENVVSGMVSSIAMPAGLFLDPKSISMGGAIKPQSRYVGTQTIGQTKYEVVALTVTEPLAATIKLFISPARLITRSEMEINQQGQKIKQTAVLTNIKTGQPFTNASFAYTPPKDAKPFDPNAASQDYEAKLVPVGKPAPAFSLPTPTGGNISLYEATKEKKAVLVNFWFYG